MFQTTNQAWYSNSQAKISHKLGWSHLGWSHGPLERMSRKLTGKISDNLPRWNMDIITITSLKALSQISHTIFVTSIAMMSQKLTNTDTCANHTRDKRVRRRLEDQRGSTHSILSLFKLNALRISTLATRQKSCSRDFKSPSYSVESSVILGPNFNGQQHGCKTLVCTSRSLHHNNIRKSTSDCTSHNNIRKSTSDFKF